MEDFRGKKILIVGLGRSGLAASRYLAQRGALVTVTDTKPRHELEDEIKALEGFNIEYCLGSNPKELFVTSDLVVLSPGVPPDIEGVRLAMENGRRVVCEMELVVSMLKGRFIGVSGTNGKSTTTVLIGELLKAAGKSVWVGGNIGNPLIGGIDEATKADYVVCELSSYQLETTPSLRSNIAILLNITPDHLDRYKTFDDYVRAKALIGRLQKEDDWIIFNIDDPIVSREVESFRSKKLPFSLTQELQSGASYNKNVLEIKNKEFNFSVDARVSKLKGIHNRENIAAASLAAALCGLRGKEVKKGLADFLGLPHRLQFVRNLDGVSYYNDSKGTNVGAVVRSIQSFNSPVILIAGGQDKNTGYQELREVVKKSVRSIFAIGEAAERIRKELGDVTNVSICCSLEDAVNLASSKSVDGDVVLLSPACASFDMFKNYAERGDVFVKCVNNLRLRK